MTAAVAVPAGEARQARRPVGRLYPAVVVAAWAGGALLFFRDQWTTGFRQLQGNDGDTRLEAYLCEHWFRVLHGQASWLDPQFFHPLKGLLGWSDTFFVYQVLYAPLRLVGADPFLALQLTVVLLGLVGFVTFTYLVRQAFAAPLPLALAGAEVFCFSNALRLHAGSVQDFGVYLLPGIALLGMGAWRAGRDGRRASSVVLGACAGLLWSLLLFSTYYVGYFSALAAAVVLVVLALAGRRAFVGALVHGVRGSWPALTGAVGGLAAGLVPFLVAYLPARGSTPGSTYAEVMSYAGGLRDLVDVGPGNVLWSSLVHSLVPRVSYSAYELTYAVTPVVMLATVAGAAACWWWLRSGAAVSVTRARAAAALGLSSVVVAVLPLHTRLGTPWALLHQLPGAGAMRAIDRVQLVTWALALVAACAAGAEAWAHLRLARSPMLRFAALALVVLALVEQVNTTPVSQVNRRAQTELLHAVPAPPAGCRSFYVLDAAQPGLPYFEYQIDAMLVSQRWSIPTLNGYTAYSPVGWGLEDPGSPGYLAAVRSWAASEGVDAGLCQLDLGDLRWSRATG